MPLTLGYVQIWALGTDTHVGFSVLHVESRRYYFKDPTPNLDDPQLLANQLIFVVRVLTARNDIALPVHWAEA